MTAAVAGTARVLSALALLAMVPHAAAPAAPLATVARPCASNALCVCRGDHFACDNVPFYRFPETEAGALHVAVSAARLDALHEAALDARPLRTLVLVDSRLHRVDPRAFASMTASLASLDLGHNEFTEVPAEALRHLKVLNWLNLQNNYISDLDPEMEWGGLTESLTTLSLSNNHLCVLREGALSSLRRLVQLELDGNRLRHLPPGALPAALAVLRLSDNLLPELPSAALLLLPRLRHLNLRNNVVRRLNGTRRHERSKIDSLDLSHNELDDTFHLECHSFHLKRLALDLNDFSCVPSFVAECGRLQQLSLSHNSVQRVSDAVIHALRRSLQVLVLDHNELVALPTSLRQLEQLRRLVLAYNQLEHVEELPPNLHSLSLAGNFLTTFPFGLRRLNPASLNHLDLGYNRISYVGTEHFVDWAEALTTLNLRGNRLAQLSLGSFPPLPLQELVLSFNDLYSVEAGVFSNLTELRVLELSTALFSGEIPTGSSCGALTWLNLDNNNIHFVSSDDLLNFPSLQYLNLDFNRLTEFPSETSWTNVSYKIKELRVSYNYISTISSLFLEELSELQSVDLSYNRMQNISERGFSNLQKLVYLHLVGNVVELIADEAFVNLPKLEELNLQENSLEELSTRCLLNVSNMDVNFSVNVSYNRIKTLSGGKAVFINILDLSHNLIEVLSRDFFDSLGDHVRQISLSHNKLFLIDTFGVLPNLNVLNLQKNNISAVKRRISLELPTLQTLDLSDNQLAVLAPEQFRGLRRLRELRLDGNRLRVLPRDALRGTMLESLGLARNHLATLPAALLHVGFTLRRLQLAHNRLARLDAALRAAAYLRELGLAHNALGALPDAALAALPRLLRLDLSGNALQANFRELLLPVPRLRRLALARAGLRSVPTPLPASLTELDLSGNFISECGEGTLRLPRLRALDLSANRFTALRPAMWTALPRLVSLDVSRNPVARLPRGCFDGLAHLLHLHMKQLEQVEAVEPRALGALVALRSLAMDAPLGRERELPLAALLVAVPHVEAVALELRSEALDQQLMRLSAPKLRALELRGVALAHVSARALVPLAKQRALALTLARTRVAELPAGLLQPLARVPQLALDISDNRLAGLGPAPLYPNLTDWNRFGTKLLPGGLLLAGNPLRCGCAGAWAAQWLRRWTSEVGGGARAALAAARRSQCVGGAGPRALLAQGADEAECRSSALAAGAGRALPALGAALLAAWASQC